MSPLLCSMQTRRFLFHLWLLTANILQQGIVHQLMFSIIAYLLLAFIHRNHSKEIRTSSTNFITLMIFCWLTTCIYELKKWCNIVYCIFISVCSYTNCLQHISDNCGIASTMWYVSNTFLVTLKAWIILGSISHHSAATWIRLSTITFT